MAASSFPWANSSRAFERKPSADVLGFLAFFFSSLAGRESKGLFIPLCAGLLGGMDALRRSKRVRVPIGAFLPDGWTPLLPEAADISCHI